ncbi:MULTISPECIES: hypothetical protein [unclassified Paenibacillus]|uniref:hypothetical protein n=1 Tax=unclassified Paenibacillus TaxID=185978 RepID=UPI00095673B1|nr:MULTISPECIES: hypothetical protein [unclassified Paenibacillus]ASS68306.1 hypothetical protein CIC07_20860 [Paenibacillus sp. RUD330]SIR28377.1 hypothetical protein SAMN05880555_3360 [Paenibacillus sp. RU4X]SIR40693.1 hypothetical protein SAMN05880570_3361 [Paenibacillus sp. RU4T]
MYRNARIIGIFWSILFAAALVFGSLSSPLSAASADGAKTSAPPQMFSTFGLYEGYTYLGYGNESIYSEKGVITLTAMTQAKTTVPELGATFQLQKWTGTQWIDSGVLTTLSSKDTNVFQNSVLRTGDTGYYFRGKIVHFVKNGNVTEQASAYTANLLCS